MPEKNKIKDKEFTSNYLLKNEALNKTIDILLNDCKAAENADLLRQMITTTLKLEMEKVDRGDLKILNTSLKELRWAFKVFRPYKHIRKVTIFGSARIDPKHVVYKQAKNFAKIMVESNWMVITGASTGIMNAGNEGAGRAFSFGANIRLPFEQDVNPTMLGDRKLINFKYFFARKLIFIKESSAIVLCPGGFGTLDEGFEALTLIQTGKSEMRPVIMLDHPKLHYWNMVMKFVKQMLLKNKLISLADMSLIHHVYDIEEARDILLKFYKNYHSMRFVGDQLVIRIQRELSKSDLKILNNKFKDIITKGKILSAKTMAEEANDLEAAALPRLAFDFDRRSFGRLRQMIDMINLMGD